ncbi:MAG: amino acid racemase [Calditrichaeota bacterium]|nr:MAG: amino acid racemase [Calditrichota bacterium]
MPKILGILGGMGPLSTVKFMEKVIRYSPVTGEQEHLRMLVDNRPEIPDRTAAILGKGPSPLPYLQDSARLLEQWGAEVLAMPCNTAHHFIREVQAAVSIPLLDMLQFLAREMERQLPPDTPVALFATTGSIRANLFQNYLSRFHLIIPPPDIQESLIMEAIYGPEGVKAHGDMALNREKLLRALKRLTAPRPQAVVAGCTEIALALEGASVNLPLFDPLDILAHRVVEYCYGESFSF